MVALSSFNSGGVGNWQELGSVKPIETMKSLGIGTEVANPSVCHPPRGRRHLSVPSRSHRSVAATCDSKRLALKPIEHPEWWKGGQDKDVGARDTNYGACRPLRAYRLNFL